MYSTLLMNREEIGMEQDDDGRKKGLEQHDDRHVERGRISRRVIQSATALAIVAGVVLVGGFAYASYAAYGGSVGTVLGNAEGNSSLTGAGNAAGGTPSSGNGNASNASGQTAPSSTLGQVVPGSTLPKSQPIHLIALGDSLTHGLGDASGAGYVGDLVAHFRTAGYTVIQSNLGVDGQTSKGLVAEMAKPSTLNLLRPANFVLISIGGNDLSQAAGLPEINTAKVAEARAQFQANLKQILTQIRKVNPSATIFLVGLYNPYGDVAVTRRQTDSIVETWNADEQTLVAQFPGAMVVQTYDLFELNPKKYLYIDHFHPNQEGYQRIAERVWQDAEAILGS